MAKDAAPLADRNTVLEPYTYVSSVTIDVAARCLGYKNSLKDKYNLRDTCYRV